MAAEPATPGIPDISLEEEELALTLRAVAWTLLMMDALLLIFVPIDIRVGLSFWTVWALAQGALGLALFGWASRVERRATLRIAGSPAIQPQPAESLSGAAPSEEHPRAA